MRTRHIATFAETIRTDPMTLAREYLSARDATTHEFPSEEARTGYVDVLLALGRFQHRTSFERALAHLETAHVADQSGTVDHRMRPIAWSFGSGATFPGYTDDSRWNGFLNVWVAASSWPRVLDELIAGADGDTALIEDYRRIGQVEGLIALSNSFTTSEVTPDWLPMFPDYPVETMVPIPADWGEMSWRHETAPSFGPCVGPMGEAAQIWIDYEKPSMREFPEGARFTFSRRDAVSELTVVYAGDDYDEALRHIAIESLACDFANRLGQQLDPSEWRNMRVGNQTVDPGVCASQDYLDANIVMLDAWRAIRAATVVGNGDVEAFGQDLDHVNAAWAIASRCYLTASNEGARFDEWRLTGRDVPSLVAEGLDPATVPPSDCAGRVYSVGFLEADGAGWIANVGNSSQAFDHLIDADAHLWSLFASAESQA